MCSHSTGEDTHVVLGCTVVWSINPHAEPFEVTSDSNCYFQGQIRRAHPEARFRTGLTQTGAKPTSGFDFAIFRAGGRSRGAERGDRGGQAEVRQTPGHPPGSMRRAGQSEEILL